MAVVRGIDVSAYQTLDYAEVARHVKFVIVKATEGTRTVSSAWSRHWNGVGKARLTRGSYHIGHPEQGHSPQAEADHYVATLRAAGWRSGWDLPPVLDIEPGSVGVGKARLTEWALQFMRRVDEKLGLTDPWLRCGIYIGDSIRNAVDLDALHHGRWYWRGGYGNTWPTEVPSGCAIYQRVAPVSAVPGVRGSAVDIDVVRPEDFARMVPRRHQQQQPQPEPKDNAMDTERILKAISDARRALGERHNLRRREYEALLANVQQNEQHLIYAREHLLKPLHARVDELAATLAEVKAAVVTLLKTRQTGDGEG